ncbi:acyltransferase family protein [Microbacterium testaceum]|uniref:acyltransferase family protein n=1 Tax=Microbacterium testaceum TaxID=2033 RepID=UPI001D172421|nr:acyltransferase [Microbacterium testaceum]MCC4247847.1 acyltransferase [Microbacterium testaceum]
MTISTTMTAPRLAAASPASGLPPAARHLPSLTGLRWLTAMLIFGHHIMAVEYFGGRAGDLWGFVFEAGKTGVTLFFILSGFVLAWGHKPAQTARSFWLHRAARIYPLHVVGVVLALVAAATLVPEIRTDGLAPLGANVLLLSGWVPDWWQAGNPASWSLVCEAFFYLTFPLVIRLVAGRTTRVLWAVAAGALLLVALAPQIAAIAPVPMSAASTPVLRLPEFVLGVVLALVMKETAWRPAPLRFAVPLAVLGYALSEAPALPGTEIRPGLAATVGGFALLVASLASADAHRSSTFLAGAAWQELGRLSFAFYLVHLLVIASVSSAWPDGHPELHWPRAVALAALAFMISLGLGWLLHRGVETRVQRVLLRFDPDRRGGAVARRAAVR